jgi:hypothetical protein
MTPLDCATALSISAGSGMQDAEGTHFLSVFPPCSLIRATQPNMCFFDLIGTKPSRVTVRFCRREGRNEYASQPHSFTGQ